jgi:hypothetical protein
MKWCISEENIRCPDLLTHDRLQTKYSNSMLGLNRNDAKRVPDEVYKNQ